MQAVKSKDTSIELRVRRLLYSKGYRYRLHGANLPGKPDIVFAGRRKVIFINGCFWHGHDCPRGARIPKTNREYWSRKINRNRERDEHHRGTLQAAGWEVFTVWECHLKTLAPLTHQLRLFLEASQSGTASPGECATGCENR